MKVALKYSSLVMAGLVLTVITSAAYAAAPPKVVFIGDSITYAWPFPANSNWINKGLPGIDPWSGQTASSVVRHTDRRLSNEALARVTFSRMSEAFAVQMNGFGF